MIPKISVSPLATRKRSSPYCTALRACARKVGKSMLSSIRKCLVDRRDEQDHTRVHRSPRGTAAFWRLGLQAAAFGRIGQGLDGDTLNDVVHALDLAQVDVLHRIVGARHAEAAAWTVDDRSFHA